MKLPESPIRMYRSKPKLCEACLLTHENIGSIKATLDHYEWPNKIDGDVLKIVTGENMVLAIEIGEFIIFAPDGQPYASTAQHFMENFELVPK